MVVVFVDVAATVAAVMNKKQRERKEEKKNNHLIDSNKMVSSEICSHLVFGVGVINFRADLSKVLAHASRARAHPTESEYIYM